MKFPELKIYRFLTSLEEVPQNRLIVITGGIILILGYLDYLTGFELSFSFFYLIPITVTAWAFERKIGLASSVICALVWLTSNLLSGQHFSTLFVGVWNTMIRFGFYSVVTVLLSELHQLLETERVLANTDPLTGALNRRSFYTIVEKRMIFSEVNKRPYTLVFIDLDNFKTVNDSLGHAEGDKVLKSVVNTLQAQIRNSDLLARLGGDEFLLLLMDIDKTQAINIIQRLQSSLLNAMKTDNWPITFSIGVLTVLSVPDSTESLISLTDELMYKVKSKGKNAILYSTFDM